MYGRVISNMAGVGWIGRVGSFMDPVRLIVIAVCNLEACDWQSIRVNVLSECGGRPLHDYPCRAIYHRAAWGSRASKGRRHRGGANIA